MATERTQVLREKVRDAYSCAAQNPEGRHSFLPGMAARGGFGRRAAKERSRQPASPRLFPVSPFEKPFIAGFQAVLRAR